MNLELLYKRLISKKGLNWKILLLPLYLLSLIYSAIIKTRVNLYRFGIIKRARVGCKVIGIGNITLGGSGKTPMTIYISRLLANSGFKIVAIGHGYRGRYRGDLYVVSDGKRISTNYKECGEEAVMMALQLKGIPVIVGKERYRCIEYALKRFDPEVIVLDDAFQYLRVIKDLDILLIDSSISLTDNYLIPRGILREGWDSIKRADLVILTKVKNVERGKDIGNMIKARYKNLPVYYSYYEPASLTVLNSGEDKGIDYLKGKRIVAMAGIGDPSSFFELLERLGAIIEERLIFPDHHPYSPRDLIRLNPGYPIITTEKDAIKLKGMVRKGMEIMSLNIRVRFYEEERFNFYLLNRLNG